MLNTAVAPRHRPRFVRAPRGAGTVPAARETVARALLRRRGMKAVMFTHKRFVLLAGYAAREIGTWAGITPARIDLLLQLFDGPLVQREIAVRLGVTDVVVSRMVTALEKLGHVTRTRRPRDQRFRVVTIAVETMQMLKRQLEVVLYEGIDGNVQSCAEQVAFWAWRDELERRGIRMNGPADEDQAPLLERLLFAVRRWNYTDAWYQDAETPLCS